MEGGRGGGGGLGIPHNPEGRGSWLGRLVQYGTVWYCTYYCTVQYTRKAGHCLHLPLIHPVYWAGVRQPGPQLLGSCGG